MVDKAEILVLDANDKVKDTIPVMFNPTEYSVTTTAQIGDAGNTNNSTIQFNRVDVGDFIVELFFDTYEEKGDKKDVRNEIKKIVDLVVPTVEKKETKQPPICVFSWGKFTYKGIIYKIVQNYKMFLETGIPVRAVLTVTFKPLITKEEDAKFSGKYACRKLWTVKSGDRLDLIAHNTLSDASLWRKIADANNIKNPVTFPTDDQIGRILVIPD